MTMRTKRISADEARHLRRDQLQGDRLEHVSRSAPSSWDAAARSAKFVMSAQSPDRMGDIVITRGIDVKNFQKNPVALFAHQSRAFPIGNWKNITKVLHDAPPHLDGDLQLLPAGGPSREVDQVAWAIEHGALRAASVGFIPNWDAIEMLLDDSGDWSGGLIFHESELVETSIVPVPAHPSALAKAYNSARDKPRKARGELEAALAAWIDTPEGNRAFRRLQRASDLAAIRARGR